MPTVVSFDTLTDLYQNLAEKYKNSDKTAFAFKPGPNEEYAPITWEEVSRDVESLAAYLIEEGIEKGDRVALLSENRYEWAVVDLAVQLIGAVNVSLYATLPHDQCEYILEDSESKIFFVSTGIQLKKATRIFDNLPTLSKVIAFDKPRSGNHLEKEYVELFEEVRSQGSEHFKKHMPAIKERASKVKSDDLATLIYTSGTTGKPKGAMLTHNNIVSNIKAAHLVIDISGEDRVLSFLPLCHAFERTAGYYAMIAGGAEIFYAESVDTVARNMTEALPTVIISVPRLFEKIYNLVNKSIEEGTDVKKKIFSWALDVGSKYADGKRGLISLQKKVADKLVFEKLKQRTGGRIRFFVSGGAALPPEIGSFFMAAGLNILEGYGLTETSPVIAVNKYGEEMIGTVGKIIPGVSVAIQRLEDNEIIAELDGEEYPSELDSDSGEILVKGPNVMKGYWKKELATKEMIDDSGWLHTGDVGRFNTGRLQITDRIKHMIVNAGGKNIYPGPIEDTFKTNKYVDQLVIVGEGQPYMAALVSPDFEVLESYAKENDIEYDSMEELIEKEEIQQIFNDLIRKTSKNFASHEKVRDFRLVPDTFSVETGELTPTLKVKRRVITDRYEHLINDMFKDAG